MGSRKFESLLGLPAQMSQLHRRVVRVGAVAAWVCAAIYLAVGLASGNDALVAESLGPIVAATMMTIQIIFGREHAGVALVGSAVIVTVTYGVMSNPSTLLPAAMALVVICSLAMLFVTRQLPLVSAAMAGALFVAPLAWNTPGTNNGQVGLMMSLSFVMATAVFITVRNSATAIDTKYRGMFEESPVALFDEDWSESLNFLREAYGGKAADLTEYLVAHPEFVRQAVERSVVTKVNRAGVDLLQMPSPSVILGSRKAELIPEQLIGPYTEFLVNLYEGANEFELVYRRATYRGNDLWLQARCVNPPAIGGPSSVLIAVADVTPSHDRQEALVDLVDAKDKFIASVSHELRTPLTAVVGLTSEMTSRAMDSEELTELTEVVAAQAAEMSYIIEDLLVASRANIGDIPVELRDVDLGEQVRAAIASTGLSPTAVPANLPTVLADAGRVRQILRNLFTNVERYGGTDYRIVGGSDEDKAWIEVRDNGEGVNPAKAPQIFEPYATAHGGVAGSVGLGLSVARQLADLMNGSLQYHREGGETVFRLELPLSGACIPAG